MDFFAAVSDGAGEEAARGGEQQLEVLSVAIGLLISVSI
jgi:hypothetical protein